MDKYFEEDKAKVINELETIKAKLNALCKEDITKEQMMQTLVDCIKGVSVLGFKLKHIEGFDSVEVSSDNRPGLDVIKSNLAQFCEEIDQSLEDTSWIEDTDTFAENQRSMVEDLFNTIEAGNLAGPQRAMAEQQLEEMRKFTPQDGAADWVVRGMRNEILLMGIKSHLNSALVSIAEA